MPELKPCPFCGGEAIAEMNENWYWEYEVYCTKCGATFQTSFDTEEEAVKAWNRRADNG